MPSLAFSGLFRDDHPILFSFYKNGVLNYIKLTFLVLLFPQPFLVGILPSPVEHVKATGSAEYYPFYKYPEQIEKGTSSNKITIE